MHLHTDVIHITVFAFGAALVFHIMRGIAGYAGNHGMPALGKGLGGFFTFPAG